MDHCLLRNLLKSTFVQGHGLFRPARVLVDESQVVIGTDEFTIRSHAIPVGLLRGS